MSGKKGEVVYRRPKSGFEDLDPENWHDLAICNAYDRAVNAANVKLPERATKPKQNTTTPHSKTSHRDSSIDGAAGDNVHHDVVWTRNKDMKKAERKEPQDSAKDSSGGSVWKAGDKCVALYSEDGLYYDGTILSFNKTKGECVVEYDGYGNKENVKIGDIYTSDAWNDIQQNHNGRISHQSNSAGAHTSSSYTTTSSMSSATEETSSDVTQDIYTGRAYKKKKSEDKRKGRSRPKNGYPFESLRSMAPPSFNMNPLFGMPPPPPFMAPSFLGRGMGTHHSDSKLTDLSDDALSSMLMSWYMAGYHTGYYQGIANGGNATKAKRK